MHILDDNEKICAKCGKVFDDTFPFGFCLWCGYKLKKVNEYLHEENVEFETSGGICLVCREKFYDDCREKFYGNGEYCPKCGNKLLKGKIDLKERTFETKWNNDKVKYSFEALSGKFDKMTDPFQVAGVRDVLLKKSYFDKKLKEDCIIFEQPQSQKLTFNQVEQSINTLRAYSLGHKIFEYHFITANNINEKELLEIYTYSGFTKIGENLFLIFDTVDNIKIKLNL